jgi:aspartyl-tRNA synthetase
VQGGVTLVTLVCTRRYNGTCAVPLPSPPPSSSTGSGAVCLAGRGVSIASIRLAFDKAGGVSTAAMTPASILSKEGAGAPVGREVTVRARVERFRGRGKLGFLHLRQPPLESLQAVCIGKELTAAANALNPESIVDVTGVLQRAVSPVQSTTCQHCELRVTALRVVSPAATPLPFPYRDDKTKLDTRLNHRVMDLRTDRMVAITRLVSALGESFRQQLLARQFIEVHTPKLIATASEGGSNVFTVDYFGKRAYLAQSPQLYKQMMLMGDAMRVFEIGPVFRAENSLTHRHLTEFVGLDGEMVIEQHYTEVLDVLEPVVCAMLTELTTKHLRLIDTLWRQSEQQERNQLTEAESRPVESQQLFGTTANSSATSREERVAGDSLTGGRGGRQHSLRDVCCEVPESVIESLSLTIDAAGAASPSLSSASGDCYHARVGGVSGCRVLRLAFADAAQLLIDKGGDDVVPVGCTLPLTDFTLPQERRLGELIKDRYGVDLYVVDLFPAEARPFYTMPLDPANPDGPTRSYDMYLRGEEICSGAQRIDQVELLEQRLRAKKVDRSTVTDYIDAFRYGAWPHGGFGLGLERIALFFLDLDDIRHVSLFPRDPKRITP